MAVYNRTAEKTREFMAQEVGSRPIRAGYTLAEFVELLQRPRAIILLVSAGPAVDAVVAELLPYLEPGDLIIDGGNSHFTDTDRRDRELAASGVVIYGYGDFRRGIRGASWSQPDAGRSPGKGMPESKPF